MEKYVKIPTEKITALGYQLTLNDLEFGNELCRKRAEEHIKECIVKAIADHLVITTTEEPDIRAHKLSASVLLINQCEL